MTHQQNKQFNIYKEELDLESFYYRSDFIDYLRKYCEEHGEERMFERGIRQRVGELARECLFFPQKRNN
jgi:hypothetical protein